jgi:hypothetical protein
MRLVCGTLHLCVSNYRSIPEHTSTHDPDCASPVTYSGKMKVADFSTLTCGAILTIPGYTYP